MTYCYTVADSVEFLDLSAPEFHETRDTTALYALDLSVAPRRYGYLSYLSSRVEIIANLTRTRENGNFPPVAYQEGNSVCPSRKLIRVSRFEAWEMPSFFSDFIISVLERLPRNSESGRIRFCLKYMKEFCRYVEKSMIILDDNSSVFRKIILTSERPPIAYYADNHLYFIDIIKFTVAPKLIAMLFKSVCADSDFVAGIFCMVLRKDRTRLLFMNEAKVMEYLLHHLKKEKYNIRKILDTLQENFWHCALLRSNPEHLVVFLNYGFKIKFRPKMQSVDFLQLYPMRQQEMYTPPDFINAEWSDLTPREEAILEMFAHFCTFKVSHFTIYIKSLRYVWRSIPDAFISYKEMRTLLLRNVDAICVEYMCNKLQEREFVIFDTILQPRSLAHYSRCALRNSLKRNSQLPEGIELLGLANNLKSYLRLEF